MPTYDYHCDSCNSKFEVFRSITDNSEVFCPICKSNNTKKLVSVCSGIIFKGSGFYTTDYKRNSQSKESNNTNKSDESKK